MLASLRIRLTALFLRRQTDADLDEELQYHLERETDRNVACGMSPADAHDAARRSVGNLTVASEAARDAMRWRWLDVLVQLLEPPPSHRVACRLTCDGQVAHAPASGVVRVGRRHAACDVAVRLSLEMVLQLFVEVRVRLAPQEERRESN